MEKDDVEDRVGGGGVRGGNRIATPPEVSKDRNK